MTHAIHATAETTPDKSSNGTQKNSTLLPDVGQLSALLMAADSESDMYSRLVQWIARRPEFAGTGCHRMERGALQPLGKHQFTGPAFENELFNNSLAVSATNACSGSACSLPLQNIRNVKLVSVPVVRRNQQFDSLTAAIVNSTNDAPEISRLLLAAAEAGRWHAEQQIVTGRQHLATTAATLELLNIVESAHNFRSATITVVNALRDHMNCRAIVLGLVAKPNEPCRVSAVSGLAEFDKNAEFTEQLQETLSESIVRDRLSVCPAEDSNNRDTLLAHNRLRKLTNAARITSHVLKNSSNEVVGAWMAIEDEIGLGSQETPILLRAAAPKIGSALQLACRADSGFFAGSRRSRSAARWFVRGIVAAVVAGLLLLIPVPYSVHCPCSAEPKVRRFIVAPHAGLIEKTFAEPGDTVQQGTLLAQMDGRDIRWELAGLSAEYEQAQKQHDSGLLAGDVASAQQAGLEMKRLDARRNILTRQIQQLEVTSPIAGIVLEGHLDRVENAPVSMGEALYEVAPLSPIAVEVAISDDEFANVKAGCMVNIRFDGLDTALEGTVRHVHSRSEVRDGNNVFVAEVILENSNQQLRPGMSGYARVTGATHSLGWNLFHKPWEHFRRSLPF